MNKAFLFTSLAATLFAFGTHGQGTVSTVTFNNRYQNWYAAASTNSPTRSHVYGGGSAQIHGNTEIDIPSGSTVYPGLLIGTDGGFAASTTYASLLGGPAGSTEDQLRPGAVATELGGGTAITFRTGLAAGNTTYNTATFNNIAPDAESGVFQLVAWDNSSGQYSTWALAQTAWEQGLIAAGKSAVFGLTNIGGLNPPPGLYTLTSFNIWMRTPRSVVPGLPIRLNVGAASPQQAFTIQASTNLTDWVAIATATNNNGFVDYIENDCARYPARFFRAVPMP